MRLVAVAMSAMLAAGMIPVGAYGEELTAGDEVAEAVIVDEAVAEEVVEDAGTTTQGGYVVVQDSLKWDSEKLEVEYQIENEGTKVAVAEKDYNYKDKEGRQARKEATCEEPAQYALKAVLEDGNTYWSDFIIEKEALGHKWVEDKGQSSTRPTCTKGGEAEITYICSVCGATKTEKVNLEKQDHKWGPVQTEISEKAKSYDNVDLKTLELVDESKAGYYTVITYQVCEKCGEKKIISEDKVDIESQKVLTATIMEQEGITTNLVGLTMNQYEDAYVNGDEEIFLDDCTKDGKFRVEYRDGDNKVVSNKWFTVEHHHNLTDTVIEFDTKLDKEECDVDEETLEVTNNSCWKTITYYEVTHCKNPKCPNKACKTDAEGEHFTCKNTNLKEVSRVAKTVDPKGDHIYNVPLSQEVEKAVDADGYADLDAVKAKVESDKNYTKLGENTATCTEDGTIKVTFLCKICKAEAKTIELKTKALGHDPAPAVGEYVQRPTCTQEGLYDAVVYCKRCGEELKRREDIKVPRLPHTNELVDKDGKITKNDTTSDEGAYIVWEGNRVVEKQNSDGEYLGMVGQVVKQPVGEGRNTFSVSAKLVTNCKVCGNHEVEIKAKPTVKIIDIEKEGVLSCQSGYITLEATYTTSDDEEVSSVYTVPYWTSMDAFAGAIEHKYGQPVEEKREDGTYLVVRCQVCGDLFWEQKIADEDGDEVKDGLCLDDDGVWRYYEEDEFAEDFTGIAPYDTGEFFVGNGVLCSDANGLNLYDGTWYFLSKGQIQLGYSGFAEYDGAWFIIEDGELNTKANGLYDYMGGTFLFAAGKLQDQVNGLWQDADGTWYFLAKGQVQTQFSGVAEYDGAFFVVENGVFQADYNGTVEYDGHTFNVVKGQLYGEVAA